MRSHRARVCRTTGNADATASSPVSAIRVIPSTCKTSRITGTCRSFRKAFLHPRDHAHASLVCSEVKKLPHWSQPTHIMSLLKYIENGSVKMFWISGTK